MKVAIVTSVLIASSLLHACSRGHIGVAVHNVGIEPLRSVVVHVTGNAYSIGDIPPGGRKSIEVKPSSESHIELEFAGHPRLVIDSYFEPRYKGTITAEVTQLKVVAVSDTIEPYP